MIKNGKIEILQNIEIDKSLKKYQTQIKTEGSDYFLVGSDFGVVPTEGDNGHITEDINLQYLEKMYSTRPSFLLKVKIWLYKKIFSKIFKRNSKRNISINDLRLFFEHVKGNMSELDFDNINEVINKYDSVLNNAKSNNQIALTEQILDYIDVLKNEIVLCNTGFNRFLNEEDVVSFYNIASKHDKYNTNLYLTYIKNFCKNIPTEITELKIKADELKVFDNYVILHYDYDGKSVKDTKEEIEKKRDPILFGVFKNSNRLYFIGDWIDEYCDLTLDGLIKTIGIDNRELVKNISYNLP